MRMALAQTHIIWENKRNNISNAEDIILHRANKKLDVILFPEMSFTGFSMNTGATGETDGNTVIEMQGIAKRNSINIGFGWVEKSDFKCRNIYTLVNKRGEVVSSYAKIHPFSYSEEDKYFEGGDKMVTFDMKGVPFSNFICYDLRFPELFRAVADKVHAIIVPANWPAKRSEHWKTLLKARAIENQVYIFAVNCYGDMDGQYYSGDSCVINPNGEVVKMLSDQEGVIEYEFIDDVEEYRKAFPVIKDKRPDIYGL